MPSVAYNRHSILANLPIIPVEPFFLPNLPPPLFSRTLSTYFYKSPTQKHSEMAKPCSSHAFRKSPHNRTHQYNAHSVLTATAASNEAQIIEFGHLILHDSRAVSQLGAIVLVVAGLHRDHGAVANVAQTDHLEGDRQRFVRSPVRRQHGAHEQRAAGPDQLARVLGQKVAQRPFGQDVGRHFGVGVVEQAGGRRR